MLSYKIREISTLGNIIKKAEGIPIIFLDGINNYWVKRNKKVLAVLLEKDNDLEWKNLGYNLISQFSCSTYLGLALDGYVPSIEYRDFFHCIGHEITHGFIDIRDESIKHPTLPEVYNPNFCVLTIQNITCTSWYNKIFSYVSPDTFRGCDMLLTFYNDNMSNELSHNEIYNIDGFLESLNKASSWIIPIDDSIGFFIGYDNDDYIYDSIIKVLNRGI